MGSSTSRTVRALVANALICVAIILGVRLVVLFFGQLASQSWGRVYLGVTRYLAPNLGFPNPRTPYGGSFDTEAALILLACLGIEWALSSVRDGG